MWKANFARKGSRFVPKGIIEQMMQKLDIPSPVESHRVEHVIGT